MKLKNILLCFFILASISSFGQIDLMSVEIDNDQIPVLSQGIYGRCSADSIYKISIFRDSIFHKDYSMISFNREIELKKTKYYKGIVVSWPSKLIQGNFELVFNSCQIYLKDGLVNGIGSECRVYWVVNIKEQDFKLIYKAIKSDSSLFSRREKKYKSYYLEYNFSKYLKEPNFIADTLSQDNSKYLAEVKDTFERNFKSIMDYVNKNLENDIDYPSSDLIFYERKPIRLTNYFNFK